ncbi:hypothetical protein GA0070610_1746 [Micromonospora echinofusca]|uniref:Uncharacterized protein n=1 Tax=Micromonospora echinofusca TaxID=47858 RepID=A0A1C5G7G7_MICEH|nr:hypothetical protein [Micromonospora echinofusca]SCG15512.1 hypothetical protein GA0070610_1746 [Micromonospora echinofusca]
MGCNCGSKARGATVWVLSYGDGRRGGEYGSKTLAEVADVQKGGGGVIRQVQK